MYKPDICPSCSLKSGLHSLVYQMKDCLLLLFALMTNMWIPFHSTLNIHPTSSVLFFFLFDHFHTVLLFWHFGHWSWEPKKNLVKKSPDFRNVNVVVVLSLLKPTNVTLWIAIMGNDDNDEPYLFGESESQAHTHTYTHTFAIINM